MTTKPKQPEAPPAPALMSVITMTGTLEDLPPPDNGPYYVVANERTYLHKRIHQGRVLLPVTTIDTLPDPLAGKRGFFWWDEERMPIPASLVGQVWSFFRTIFNRRHSEAMVYLTYHAKECPSPKSCHNGYHVFVPIQAASGGGVQSIFDPKHLAKGFRIIGTIHSHCDFDAFHSGTDTHDADDHDGIHMTIGKVGNNPPDIATMVSIGGVKWDFQPSDAIAGDLSFIKHPRWWERYVVDPTPENQNKHVSQWGSGRGAWAGRTSALTALSILRNSQPSEDAPITGNNGEEYRQQRFPFVPGSQRGQSPSTGATTPTRTSTASAGAATTTTRTRTHPGRGSAAVPAESQLYDAWRDLDELCHYIDMRQFVQEGQQLEQYLLDLDDVRGQYNEAVERLLDMGIDTESRFTPMVGEFDFGYTGEEREDLGDFYRSLGLDDDDTPRTFETPDDLDSRGRGASQYTDH